MHNLMCKVQAKKPLDIIFFAMIDCLRSDLHSVQASRSRPTVATTPEAVKAAFTKEGDLFKEKGVLFLDTFVNLSQPDLFERQIYEQFQDILGLSPEENKRAIEEGYRALALKFSGGSLCAPVRARSSEFNAPFPVVRVHAERLFKSLDGQSVQAPLPIDEAELIVCVGIPRIERGVLEALL